MEKVKGKKKKKTKEKRKKKKDKGTDNKLCIEFMRWKAAGH